MRLGSIHSLVAVWMTTLGGCPPRTSIDAPRDTTLSCPHTVSDQPRFAITIPCGALASENTHEIPNADFETYFFDLEGGMTYLVASVATQFVPSFSAQLTAQSGIALRYEGSARTSSGDVLVLATGYLPTGASVRFAYGLLNDNLLLMLGTDSANPLALSFFDSAELHETDGAAIFADDVPGYPKLLSPTVSGYVLLDNAQVFRLGSSERQRSSTWATGSGLLVHDAAQLSSQDPFFLTSRRDWTSLHASFLGSAIRGTINAIEEPQPGTILMVLSNGSRWEVSGTEEAKARAWKVGDEVASFRDQSFAEDSLLHLVSGEAIRVIAR